MRLARASQDASSGTLPPAKILPAASQAAPKPERSAALAIALRALRLPALSQRSSSPTSASGMSRLIVDSPKALGLATSAGTSERGSPAVSPSPKPRAGVATRLPRSARTSTDLARTPTTGPRSCQAGPTQQGSPSTRTYPRLSARACAHPAASRGVPGSAGIPARSSRSASGVATPPLPLAPASARSQPVLSVRLGSSTEATSGTGTRRFRRRNPTASSTEPLSLPGQGSRWRPSRRWWALRRESGSDSVTTPRSIRPASVASSGTRTRGARPIHPKTSLSPSQRHSDPSSPMATQRRALGWGSVTTRSLRARGTPATTARDVP